MGNPDHHPAGSRLLFFALLMFGMGLGTLAHPGADLAKGWAHWEKGERERAMAHFAGWVEENGKGYTVVTELKCSPGKLVQQREDLKGYGPVFLMYHEFKDGLCFRVCVGYWEDKKPAKSVAALLRTDGAAAEAFPVKASLKDTPEQLLDRLDQLLAAPAKPKAEAKPQPAAIPEAQDYEDAEVSEEDRARAEALFQEGVAAFQAQAVDEAKIFFMRSLQIDPNHSGAHNNLGTIFLHLGRFAEAEREFRWALKSQPNYREASMNLAGALYGQKRHEEAVRELRRLLKEDESDLGVRLNLASLLNAMGRAEDARGHLKVLLESHPTDPRVLDLAKRIPKGDS